MGTVPIFLLLLFFAVGCSRDLVATVNGATVTRATFEQALQIEAMKYDPIVLSDPGRLQILKDQVLTQLITDCLLADEAAKAGIRPTDAELNEVYDQFKGQYTEAAFQEMLRLKGIDYAAWQTFRRRRYLIDRLAETRFTALPRITAAAVEQYYREHRAEFVEPEAVQVRQIVTEDEAAARQLREAILKGGNFAQLAMQYSLTPDAREGGDLGYIPRGSFPRVFDEVCSRLPVGAMSDVVKSDYGYHLFKVLDRRPAKVIALAEARSGIEERLRQEQATATYAAWIDQLKHQGKITVYKETVARVRLKGLRHAE